MTNLLKIFLLAVLAITFYIYWPAVITGHMEMPKIATIASSPNEEVDGYAGSRSCSECHERFYTLWSTSFHGLAMQPYSQELASSKLTEQKDEITIGGYRYHADISGPEGWVKEMGPEGEKKYKIAHALGGKNVYYFLTSFDRGRLQTLPVAYDIHKTCHMPMTGFARMNRSDHSMRPPAPAATLAYQSPNACNLCHTDRDAAWADRYVREWRTRDYQAPVLKRAALIESARKRDWSKLPDMLSYVADKGRDEVVATSLIRMVPASGDPRIASVLIEAIRDPSPLVRSAAAVALQDVPTKEAIQALVEATGDGYRLVRVRAAASLAAYPNLPLDDAWEKTVEAANEELMASILSRPDQWTSHYNLGNYYLDRGELRRAIASYDTALKLEPRAVLAMVNEAMAYARLGENQKAEESLQKALKAAPDNAAAHFNMGLLKAELNDPKGAEKHLRKALEADTQMAQAAYNLCIITSRDRIDEAISWCRKAADLRPQEPRYGLTLAFYQNQRGDRDEAVRTLKAILEKHPEYRDAEVLLQRVSNGMQ
jgi:tetratricopeptide (TPR) repeat protein